MLIFARLDAVQSKPLNKKSALRFKTTVSCTACSECIIFYSLLIATNRPTYRKRTMSGNNINVINYILLHSRDLIASLFYKIKSSSIINSFYTYIFLLTPSNPQQLKKNVVIVDLAKVVRQPWKITEATRCVLSE